MCTVLHNGRFFRPATLNSQEPDFADCLVIDERSGEIKHIGSAEDAVAREAKAAGAKLQDMDGRVVVPGFIDGHMHLLLTGEALNQLDVGPFKNLEEIRNGIREYAQENPNLPRVLCRGWLQASTGGVALASDLNDLDPRPIFINAEDMHSAWVNTAALDEMGVADMEDPPGGEIHRDENGVATGLLSESAAIGIVWPFLSGVSSMEDRVRYIKDAFDAYTSSGYTGLVELAMDQVSWDALQLFRSRQPGGTLPISLATHWLVLPRNTEEETLKQVDRAIELHKRFNATDTPDCRIAGIKVLCDGVVDSCTAALREPYSHNNGNGNPIWSREQLAPVLRRADGAGLQCALHAIGDAAIKIAIDCLEQVGNPAGRHRIEHLETCTPEDAKRLGPLGITASVQPVHSDPAILGEWPKLLGPTRCKHVFPYGELAKGGAVLAIGTDSPTAPYGPLPNLYMATTRRSAREPERRDQTTPQFALSLAAAVSAATQGAAYSCFADGWTGTLEAGKAANLTVIDMKWDAEKLLEANVRETWFRGRRIYAAE
ncbi:putative amidohydrolase YtcJ [Tolypocladium ophioglossoides CBS 100239]|uniref:Putative amidohydrolase YtcJ n=1 Tax=Tolypocladium ophioglossoides (strain CBS 100239) TaxID=1163406 RepID=A0A0L0MXR6_TOLOC|nr:putative amidohydrolase YtcJ [Tolypocladium ophioglossoides CBS 100239]